MKTKNILCIIGILLLLGACSKYEDGPFMFIGNAKERLYGTYKVTYFSKNGEDLTQHWKDSCDWTFEFYDDNQTREVEDICYYQGFYYKNGVKYHMDYFGSFKIKDKKKYLWIGLNGYYSLGSVFFDKIGIFPLSTGAGRLFKIRRFKEKEIWLGYEEGADKYLIKLEE